MTLSSSSVTEGSENRYVTNVEGIIEDDVDRCIHNLTRIGAYGMNETDEMVLDIMTHKPS